MASPAELVHLVSTTTGVPLSTLTDIDRRLVSAGLRRKAGRGLHAAQMTPLDAACLLTAVLASPQANASVETVGRYAETAVDEARSSATLFGATAIEDLGHLTARHSFVDGLTALIASAANGRLAVMLASKDAHPPQIEIFAFTRATRGRIRLAALPNGTTASLEYRLPKKRPKASAMGGDHAASEAAGDLEQSRRITERTVLRVAELLAGEAT